MKNLFLKNLFLIGYRGTGKTVLGRMLAEETGMPFIDTDTIIVKNAEKSIPDIFEQEGEDAFRQYETEALEEAVQKEGQIISCGGGIIVKERNFPILKEGGIVCLLKSDSETIFKRIYKDRNRPALTNKDPKEEIVHLLEVRGPLYEKAKDFEVDTSKKGKKECVAEIEAKYCDLTSSKI